jgi:exodeoxyribonuclease-3
MEVITWNVNGIRAAYRKGAQDWIAAQSADVICLQEIKARPEQLGDDQRDLPGYEIIWNPAKRAGYSGVASFFKGQSPETELGLGEERFDVEGRTIRSRHDGFWLYNNYFPNGQRGLDRLGYKLDFYARLLEICDELHAAGDGVVITGDFNTSHNEIDLRNPKENKNTSGFLAEERAWIDKYLEHGFVDAYRYLYPERVQYTWWTYRFSARERNVGWRLDYFLVSESLLPRVRDVIIHEDVLGSDHCPVSLILD